MKVYLNNEAFILPQPSGLDDLLKLADQSRQSLILLNGTSETQNVPLKDGDRVFALKKGELPSPALYASLWAVRYGEANFKKLQEARVAICGCGGLGSHIALSLARLLQIFLCLVNKFCFIINFLFGVFDNSCSLINVDMLSFSFDREVMFFSLKN